MKKTYYKYILDAIMTVLFVLLMNTEVTGLKPHEIIGLAVCGLFVIHNLLNAKWIKAVAGRLFDKNCKPMTKFMFLLDVILLIDVAIIAASGVIISTELFSFTTDNRYLWVMIHDVSAYAGLIFISVHVGLHWKSILAAMRKLAGIKRPSKIRTLAVRTLALAIAILGIKSSIDMNIGEKMFPFLNDETADTSATDSTPLTDSVNAQTAAAPSTAPQTVQLYEKNRNGNGGGGEGEGEDEEEDNEDSYQTQGTTTVTAADPAAITSTQTDASIPTLDSYLGNLRCTGCGKHCSLLYPQCSIGVKQASSATTTYHSLYDAALAAASAQSTATDTTGTTTDSTDTTTTEPESDITQMGAVELFSDYLPMMGLLIGGTYYTIELGGKKKKNPADKVSPK